MLFMENSEGNVTASQYSNKKHFCKLFGSGDNDYVDGDE